MAQAQGFSNFAPAANKGTLMPGQTIAVNKYTVQVERYLSQGGFAHVYLVRTAQPVYGTTHHVLKRIAVPNESMLTEVKKEVDIMRILKGHPNIVHLIDAAWHRMSNGVYEVFILMEFCQGGGIIDMMNRRLRERLTEPEILTIFIEVCEGLAAMHSLKPPLLHRDLKVENILQASSSSYKLCDFGSATAVQKIPSNSQELRALEADLNRHTTLQYRAPEMVDVHMRRPIDEKSDVWALGVLLYKLCYYTTPFEEHGPLAILNVQYKIPPYPVYSQHMNALIGSMLREHGAQRPTVFEILNHVHALRGTKSRFSYNIPSKQPSIPPRPSQQPPLQTLSPNILAPAPAPANPLDDLVSYKPRSHQSASPQAAAARNAGVEARDKVLEAIAPMRRGRPTTTPGSVITPPPSPHKEKAKAFGADGERAWGGIRGHKSGMASFGGSASQPASVDAWGMSTQQRDGGQGKSDGKMNGFDSDFSSFGKGFGDSFEPARSPKPPASPAQSHPIPSRSQPIPIARPTPSPGAPSPGASPSKRVSVSRSQPKDAFDGLGIPAQPPPQTLGDARRTRTGMGALGASASPEPSMNVNPNRASSQFLNAPLTGGLGTSNTTYRPPSAHSPAPSTSSKQVDSWRSVSHSRAPTTPASRPTLGELTAEEKFPSLEDLDRKFASPSPAPSTRGSYMGGREDKSSNDKPARPLSRTGMQLGVPPRPAVLGSTGTGATTSLGASPSVGSGRFDGVRSQHVTGAAMRESRMAAQRHSTQDWSRGDYNDYVSHKDKDAKTANATNMNGSSSSSSNSGPSFSRPLPRRHRSSLTMKSPTQSSPPEHLPSGPKPGNDTPPRLPPRPLNIPGSTSNNNVPAAHREPPRDWLTGNSDDESQEVSMPAADQGEPILRESPSKRASFFERSPVLIQKALEAESGVVGSGEWPSMEELERGDQGGSGSRAEKEPKPSRFVSRTPVGSSNTGSSARGLKLPVLDTKRSGAPSPSGLTENWSPVGPPSGPPSRKGSSSSEDGPEDVDGYQPKGGANEKVKEHSKLKDQLVERAPEDPARRRRTKSKSRQGSVHDLVDLWGGNKEKEGPTSVLAPKSPEKRRSVIVPATTVKQSSSMLIDHPRSASPTPMSASSSTPAVTSSRIQSSRPASRTQTTHRKETSSRPLPGARALPTPIPTTSPPVGGRARPQSMMVGAVSKASSSESVVPATAAGVITPNNSLSPPAPDARSRRSERRASISDMVQKYEVLNGHARPGAPGSSVPKPAGLSVKVASTGSDGSSAGVSPAASAAMRYPRLSPASSPVMPKASLAVPDDAKHKEQARSGRTSPISGLPGRTSPAPSLSRFNNTPAVNGIPSRHAHTPSSAESKPFPTSSSTPAHDRPAVTRKNTTPAPAAPSPAPAAAMEEPPRAPSPEKPFLGVSRLIDRWNRAVEDSGEPSFGQTKKAGAAVGSLSGKR
ncbi:hypothetical protein EIP91_012071 [Steccherinum ochraceum]|uniref:non-specific serine/threonine protein kinase n=1 Tax=Steccherinum ochraceum TaxID=92696 RepID=A0A4R0RUC3_9APHY|nr:hypothetical protein EIP91_012071 [Steccherinum ochraceum]